jgi:BirA family biotin operon repressor/biotin-[acetyl-CoA-carboxylase] ligase
MMRAAIPLEAWPARLDHAIAGTRLLRTARVLAETASTQDVARSFAGEPGTVVVAWRQTAGRGRLGRRWSDTGASGVATTIVLRDLPSPRLVCASAVAVVDAVAATSGLAARAKWPNDVLVRGRKLAGILIERTPIAGSRDAAVLLGIGVNVGQSDFPDEVRQTATSIAIERPDGVPDRIEVLEALLVALDRRLAATDAELAAAFDAIDDLRGRVVVFAVPGGTRTGRVVRAHPMLGVRIETDAGPIDLDPATTSVVSIDRSGTS